MLRHRCPAPPYHTRGVRSTDNPAGEGLGALLIESAPYLGRGGRGGVIGPTTASAPATK